MQNILDIFKTGYMTIPLFMFKIKDNLGLGTESFLLLNYMIDKEISFFVPGKLSEIFNTSSENIMIWFNELTSKNLVVVEVKKNEKGILEEVINLDLFYSKVNNLLLDEINKPVVNSETIFTKIENEFGRVLSSMEYEIINAWLSSGTSEELIIEALKEAVMNGVTNLRYIDKILYEWEKKGYKNKEDIEKSRQNFRRSQETKRVKKEVFDYNWLEDNDE